MLDDTLNVLSRVTASLPVGTNLGLLHFLWMLVSGGLLPSRGALFPALKAIGLNAGAIRRAWRAFGKGQWQISELLRNWRGYVNGLNGWQRHRHEGYQPISVDVTAFWRPRLKTCPSQHYHPAAQRALPAIILGIVGEVGELNGQRLALPRAFERAHPKDSRETRLWKTLLQQVQRELAEDEVVVVDAGVKIHDLLEAGIQRYVIRLATNFTARHNGLPEYKRGRKPTYGKLVRPLPRQFKGQTLLATPPDECTTYQVDGRTIRVEIWRSLVLNKTIPHPDNQTFDVYAIHDPLFKQPWLLATALPLQPASVHAIYTDRWPVEQLPLSAKQMVGAHRQFVHQPDAIHRLPELALLAGSILSFLAAALPPVSTGFWDKHPKPTPGRLRRALAGQPFPKDCPLPCQFREKHSFTDHLPKGFWPRSQKTAQHVPDSIPLVA
jgi:hypothetical protein